MHAIPKHDMELEKIYPTGAGVVLPDVCAPVYHTVAPELS